MASNNLPTYNPMPSTNGVFPQQFGGTPFYQGNQVSYPSGNTQYNQPAQNGTFGNSIMSNYIVPVYGVSPGGNQNQFGQPQITSNQYIPTVQQAPNGPPSFNTPQRIVSQRMMQSPPQVQQPIITSPQQTYIQQSPQSVQYQQPSVVHNVEHVPVIHELHHVNRPINVVSVDEIEGPWRSKVLLLEKQLIELQLMMKKGPQKEIQTKQVIVEDEGKIRQLQEEIERLQAILRQNSAEIDDLQQQINEATYNLENEEEQSAGQVEAQKEELAKWKKKFSELNNKYHEVEEDITMTEAQIESIQKRKQVVTTTSTIKTTGQTQFKDGDVRKSGFSNRNY